MAIRRKSNDAPEMGEEVRAAAFRKLLSLPSNPDEQSFFTVPGEEKKEVPLAYWLGTGRFRDHLA
jgi:hypothetical protein